MGKISLYRAAGRFFELEGRRWAGWVFGMGYLFGCLAWDICLFQDALWPNLRASYRCFVERKQRTIYEHRRKHKRSNMANMSMDFPKTERQIATEAV